MLAVIQSRTGADGRLYRLPTERDMAAVVRAETELARRIREHRGRIALIPNEEILLNEIRRISVPLYGMTRWSDLFTPRQSVSLASLAQSFRELGAHLRNKENRKDIDILEECLTFLQFAFDRCLDKMAGQVVWHTSREFVDHVFAKQALPIVWVFAEADFFADIGWQGACEWVAKVIEENSKALMSGGQAGPAHTNMLIP
jgi:putative DNA methylase